MANDEIDFPVSYQTARPKPASDVTRGFVERSTSEKTRKAYQATVLEFRVFLNHRDLLGVGPDDKHIATVDADGVALAAIQGLHSMVKERDAEIEELKKRMEALEKMIQESKGAAR